MANPIADKFRYCGLSIRRMQRYDEDAWSGAKSWLGGRPRINPDLWPRSDYDNVPLHHLAQIDFTSFPQGKWSNYIPKSGALSFFLNSEILEEDFESQVIYTPEPQAHAQADPPKDCPPIGGSMWGYDAMHRSAINEEDARKVMPCWPIEFIPPKFHADDPDFEFFNPSLDEIFGPPVPDLHIFRDPQYGTTDGLGPIDQGVFPWDVAKRILQQARKHAPDSSFVKSWQARIDECDLYSEMGSELATRLEEEINHLEKEIGYRIAYGTGTTTLRDAAGEAYREMMVGPRAVYERIPTKIREYLETKRRRSAWNDSGCHQIFGVGSDPQDMSFQRSDDILLFQVISDDMMSWRWGDIGVLQFWIKPEDLIAQNWAAVEGTYAGG